MPRQAPTYDNITSLTSDLTNSTINITSRRKIAKELVQNLSDRDVQNRLALEVSPGTGSDGFSFEARRCRALSVLWSNALTRCVHMTKEIFQKSKTKCTLDDIRLPDKIVRAASKPDDVFDSNDLSVLKLSKKSVRSALKFCLETLEDEGNIPEGGERILIDMLAFLCSRDEYIGSFKYMNDYQRTLSEILHHIQEHMNHKQIDSYSVIVFESACKALSNFFGSCSRLGIEVNVFVSDTLTIISDWCKTDIENNTLSSVSTSRQHIFSALSTMLYSHPADSIGPIKRHGWHILRCCKKAYPKVRDGQKDALNQYLLSHLFVAQVAGKIQGLLDGDLGDLGSASLTETQLLSLLDHCIEDTVKTKDFLKDTSTVTMSRVRRQKISKQGVWKPLGPRLQVQLELVARLLACVQRLYIAREGWDTMEHPEELLESLLKVPGPDKDEDWVEPKSAEIPGIPVEILAKSPWMNQVLRKLMPSTRTISRIHPAVVENAGSSHLPVTPSNNPLAGLLCQLTKDDAMHESSPIPYLAIIGACTEIFPAGECWALSPTENWHSFARGEKREEVVWYHGSGVFDLAFVVSILSTLLEEHGQPENDPHVQFWILLVLTKLTETTAVMIQNTKNDPRHLLALTIEWRKTWKTLLRPDLRYVSYTNYLGENSLGEVAVILLTEIISRRCTDPLEPDPDSTSSRGSPFVNDHQKDIWDLHLLQPPIFLSVGSRAQFELISSISKYSGLSDDHTIEGSYQSLRRHLFRLSLDSVSKVIGDQAETTVQSSSKCELMKAIVSCMVCLLTGSHPCLSSISANDPRFALTKPDTISIPNSQEDDPCQVCLNILWGNNELIRKNPDLSLVSMYGSYFDFPRVVARKVRDDLRNARRRSGNERLGFISESDSEFLRESASKALDEEIQWSSEGDFDNSTEVKNSQIVGVKLILSLWVAQATLETDPFANLPRIFSFLTSTISDMGKSTFESSEYYEIAIDLRRIVRTLIEIHAHYPSRIDLEGEMTRPIRRCQSILKQYLYRSRTDGLNIGDAKVYSEEEESESEFGSLDAVYSPSGSSPGKELGHEFRMNKRRQQRKGMYGVRSNKRQKMSSLVLPPPNGKCATAIGALILAMDPSISNCRLVCKSLLGLSVPLDPESTRGDIDLGLAITSIQFLRMKEVLWNHFASRESVDVVAPDEISPIKMMCQVICLMRKSAEACSHAYMYGNIDCTELAVDMFKLGLELSEEETQIMIDTINSREGMRGRPVLRAERSQSATYIFENGSDHFHQLFDKGFANSVVKVGFDDRNFLVRRASFVAAGAASSKLDEDRVLVDVNNRTATIFSGSSVHEIIEKFSDWYVETGLSSTEEQDRSDTEAKDGLEVMESDAIFAKAHLAGSTENRTTFAKILHELLEIPTSRPGLEFMCYRALEKIALAKNYSDVQELVDLESESVLRAFLEKIRKSRSIRASDVFPASLTSPKSVFYIMMYGRYNFFCESQFSPKRNEESISIQSTAAMNFVWRYRSFIVPYALYRSQEVIGNVDKPIKIIENLWKEPEFVMLAAGLQSSEVYDNDTVLRLLRYHVVDIQAFSVVLNQSDEMDEKETGQNILRILIEAVSSDVVESKTKKNLFLLVRRIFCRVGTARTVHGMIPDSERAYYRAISDLTNTSPKSQNSSGDKLTNVGTSLTELTVYAYTKLVKSNHPTYQRDAWSRFSVLGQFLTEHLERDGLGGQIQLGFFLHMLTEIIIEPSLAMIRHLVFGLIGQILRDSVRLNQEDMNTEMASVINKLVCVCFHIHEEIQGNLLKTWRGKLKVRNTNLRRSCAFRSLPESGFNEDVVDVTGEVQLEDSMKVALPSPLDHACLVETYDILCWITENREKLKLDPYVFIALSDTCEIVNSDLFALRKLDNRFSAQDLADRLRALSSDQSLHEYISGMKHRAPRPQFLMNEIEGADRGLNTLSSTRVYIDERLVCAELLHISKLLDTTQLNEETRVDLQSIYYYLNYTCTKSHSKKVTFAASRCIALLEPRAVVDAFAIDDRGVSSRNPDDDDFMSILKARCVDCLAQCLKSPIPEVAMAAVTALEVVLSNDSCTFGSSPISATTKSLIEPFVSKKKKHKPCGTILSAEEVKELMKTAGVVDQSNYWCWDKKFWAFEEIGEPLFEAWIRNVTSAIIVCCFDPRKTKDSVTRTVNDELISFYWHSQRVACLDHRFACTIFPTLILSLVDNTSTIRGIQGERNMNDFLTGSFETLLAGGVGHQSSANSITNSKFKNKALSIVIDTLDVLRKFSQDRFLSFDHVPTRRTPKKEGRRSSTKGLEPLVSWQGLPFGTVLCLDGILVAEACMAVERFASALFFLDMYFNSQYGKSGGVFEELNDTASCSDVLRDFIGFPYICGTDHLQNSKDSDGMNLKVATLRAMSMTARCYKELGEFELMHAVNVQLSSLNFTDNPDNLVGDLDKSRRSSPLDTLQLLSFQSGQATIDNRLFLSMTESMEDLGLEGLITTYIEGILVQNRELKGKACTRNIREKWYETNFMSQNWDIATGKFSNRRNHGVTVMGPLGHFSTTGSLPSEGFFQLVSEGLNSFSNSDTNGSKLALDQARSSVIDSLSSVAAEQLSTVRFVSILDKFRALKDVDRLVEDNFDLSRFDFDQVDMLEVSLRMRQLSLSALASKRPNDREVLGALKDHLWHSCDSAIQRCRPQVAENALSELRYLVNISNGNNNLLSDRADDILRVRLEEAKLMECRGDFNGGIQKMKQLTRHLRDEENLNNFQKCLLTDAQILCGSWMTKYKTQQARVVLESYLYPAATRAKAIFGEENTRANAERAANVSMKLGHVLANLYDDLFLRVHSTEWKETEAKLQQQHKQYLESEDLRRELRATVIRSRKSSSQSAIERSAEAHRQLAEFEKSEKEYQEMNKEREGIRTLIPYYLNRALKAFVSALAMAGTGTGDLSSDVSRMISLWLSSQNGMSGVDKTNAVMQEGLSQVSSYRFVPLTNQLFSRIEHCEGNMDQGFQDALQVLVFRMCHDHPYHCLAPLIALENGKVDTKIQGAKDVVDKLANCDSSFVRDLLESYSVLVSAYNILAHTSTKKYEESKQRKKKQKIKFSEIFRSSATKALDRCLSKLTGVPSIITSPPLLRPGNDYGDGKEDPIGGERIAKFEPDFGITDSGKNRPKIVMCIGSRGGYFRQLVKGEDDIRQDAIMSQVFNYVNNLMKRRGAINDRNHSRTTSRSHRHNLKMITYFILPLSPSSGVLEWVEGAEPIMYFLNDRFGGVGSHSRYYPEEWSGDKCFFTLKKCEKSTKDEKRKVFDEICARYSPSFRFFFLERFGHCMESWHAAKMNYTRSVAVSSIVGHILGIGDRHLGNILIDKGTGEVVHIDFGFVFEQGKLLPIPECVPFRLTRNMVDGMGPCGIEGLFVNVAEETMSVLRKHDKELLAILSAVVTDPLYQWNVKSSVARRRQTDKGGKDDQRSGEKEGDSSGVSSSESTARTINKIKEKLQGYEDSTSGEQQGVEGQVQLLINSARDSNNLCTLFAGWAPWD